MNFVPDVLSRLLYISDRVLVNDKYFELNDIKNNVTVIIVIEAELALKKDIFEAYINDKRYTKIIQFFCK